MGFALACVLDLLWSRQSCGKPVSVAISKAAAHLLLNRRGSSVAARLLCRSLLMWLLRLFAELRGAAALPELVWWVRLNTVCATHASTVTAGADRRLVSCHGASCAPPSFPPRHRSTRNPSLGSSRHALEQKRQPRPRERRSTPGSNLQWELHGRVYAWDVPGTTGRCAPPCLAKPVGGGYF